VNSCQEQEKRRIASSVILEQIDAEWDAALPRKTMKEIPGGKPTDQSSKKVSLSGKKR